jgi:hypothetical protein
MSTFLQTLGSTTTSPLDMAYGAKCWADLVSSCHAAKEWDDETDTDTDAYLTIPEVPATAIPGGTVSKMAVTTDSDDFFSEPYVSFDWTADSDDTDVHTACKFKIGRYMDTIYEEVEEDVLDQKVVNEVCSAPEVYVYHSPTAEEEQSLLETPQDVILKMPESVKYISHPKPTSPLEPPSVYAIDPSSPGISEMDALFDVVPAHVLKRVGLPSNAISKRTPVVVRLPPLTDELPSYNPLSNLQMLASLASSHSPPPSYSDFPFANLNLLASCC